MDNIEERQWEEKYSKDTAKKITVATEATKKRLKKFQS